MATVSNVSKEAAGIPAPQTHSCSGCPVMPFQRKYVREMCSKTRTSPCSRNIGCDSATTRCYYPETASFLCCCPESAPIAQDNCKHVSFNWGICTFTCCPVKCSDGCCSRGEFCGTKLGSDTEKCCGPSWASTDVQTQAACCAWRQGVQCLNNHPPCCLPRWDFMIGPLDTCQTQQSKCQSPRPDPGPASTTSASVVHEPNFQLFGCVEPLLREKLKVFGPGDWTSKVR